MFPEASPEASVEAVLDDDSCMAKAWSDILLGNSEFLTSDLEGVVRGHGSLFAKAEHRVQVEVSQGTVGVGGIGCGFGELLLPLGEEAQLEKAVRLLE